MTAVLRTRRFAALAACSAAVVVVAAACGSSSHSAVPKGDVAIVAGQPVTQQQFDSLFAQYLESLKVGGQKPPQKGTSAYDSDVQRIVQYLVSKTELEQQAQKYRITVTAKEIDAGVAQTVKQYFNGSQKAFKAAMKKQHVTLAQVRENISFSVLQNKLVTKLTAKDKVTTAEALAYYNQNVSQYTKAPRRNLEHILVKTKAKAQSLYRQLQNGASFAKLAKKYSTDKTSAVHGGKLGVQYENQLVAPFAKVAFALKTGVLSKPVHSQFGWHLIEALGPVIPKSVTPFSQVKASILANLLQTKKSDTMAAFQDRMTRYYSSRVKYASAYAPPSTQTSSTPTSIIPTAPG